MLMFVGLSVLVCGGGEVPYHCKSGARSERLHTRTKGKDEDLFPDSNPTSSTLLNADDVKITNEGGGYKILVPNAEQKDLCGFYNGDPRG